MGTKTMLINMAEAEECRIAILDNGNLEEIYLERDFENLHVGHIYLGRVVNVEPAMQAAFIDFGGERNGFLHVSDVCFEAVLTPEEMEAKGLKPQEVIDETKEEAPAPQDAPADDNVNSHTPEPVEGQSQEEDSGLVISGDPLPEEARRAPRRGRRRRVPRPLEADVASEEAPSDDVAPEVMSEGVSVPELGDPGVDIMVDEAVDDSVPVANDFPEGVAPRRRRRRGGRGRRRGRRPEGSGPFQPGQEGGAESSGSSDQEFRPSEPSPESDFRMPREERRRRGGGGGGRGRDRDRGRGRGDRGGRGGFGGEHGGEGLRDFGRGSDQGRKGVQIQDVLKKGQMIVVQVTREAIDHKGPSLTTFISLAGRTLVLMPYQRKIGISRKITHREERMKLRDIMREISPPANMGYIVRTSGVGKSSKEIERDLKVLSERWVKIVESVPEKKKPCLLYEEADLAVRSLRDLYSEDINSIIIDNPEGEKKIRGWMRSFLPGKTKILHLHEEPRPLFHKYSIEDDVERIFARRITLPNGATMVIEQTEALVSIDVNTSKMRTERDQNRAILQTNLAAAREIPRQLRLRDLGGLIVCDFIDMVVGEHRREVERVFGEELRKDRARVKWSRISQFGLIEVSRQRMRQSVERATNENCPHCLGYGKVKNHASVALKIIRQIRMNIENTRIGCIEITAQSSVVEFVQNNKRRVLLELEEKFAKIIRLKADPFGMRESFAVRYLDAEGREIRIGVADGSGSSSQGPAIPGQGGGRPPRGPVGSRQGGEFRFRGRPSEGDGHRDADSEGGEGDSHGGGTPVEGQESDHTEVPPEESQQPEDQGSSSEIQSREGHEDQLNGENGHGT